MERRLNIYDCQKEGHETVTIDRDKGVTPFMIGCPVKDCGGFSHSRFYTVSDDEVPTHEWYIPDQLEKESLSSPTLEHVKKGGLLLREISAECG